mmetsp:Transcript_34128/g.92398  ORF Transcript_34128/g.92398 Transcript_34128/m.92398 type:complete len:255 (-) Transcript_34128:493-1257(-)
MGDFRIQGGSSAGRESVLFPAPACLVFVMSPRGDASGRAARQLPASRFNSASSAGLSKPLLRQDFSSETTPRTGASSSRTCCWTLNCSSGADLNLQVPGCRACRAAMTSATTMAPQPRKSSRSKAASRSSHCTPRCARSSANMSLPSGARRVGTVLNASAMLSYLCSSCVLMLTMTQEGANSLMPLRNSCHVRPRSRAAPKNRNSRRVSFFPSSSGASHSSNVSRLNIVWLSKLSTVSLSRPSSVCRSRLSMLR